MREIVITRYGGPEVMEERERAMPEPGPGEVRIHGPVLLEIFIGYVDDQVAFPDGIARGGIAHLVPEGEIVHGQVPAPVIGALPDR